MSPAQTKLDFSLLSDHAAGEVAVLTLARPDVANALSAQMLDEIAGHTKIIAQRKSVRVAVIQGAGKHFSAGADLAWMQASAKLDLAANVSDAQALIRAFEGVAQLPMPTLAVVQGAAYGGAIGLIAACDFAVAVESARFSLSEVKLGLLPAVILPYLARKMQAGALRRLALSAQVFDAQAALAAGLVQRVCKPGERDLSVREEVNALLQGGPAAQRSFKNLLNEVHAKALGQGDYTAQAIAAARTGAEGQAGLAAFFAKAPSPWAHQLPDTWSLDEFCH